MKDKIITLLTELERAHGMEILYACESGSRAWGFASPDSDYDIRFIYRRPVKECYVVNSPADTLELPMKDDLDPGGWELRKALSLLTKSNGALIEWLHSPIVYRANENFLRDMRQLATSSLSQKGLMAHYRGMAHRIKETELAKESPTGKAYLYAVRATLAAQHVLETNTAPPVEFSELLHYLLPGEKDAVEELLEWKKTALEQDSPERSITLDRFIDDTLGLVGRVSAKLPSDPPPLAPFNELLHRWTLWPDD